MKRIVSRKQKGKAPALMREAKVLTFKFRKAATARSFKILLTPHSMVVTWARLVGACRVKVRVLKIAVETVKGLAETLGGKEVVIGE